jgi:hypothetical protein
MDFVVVWPTNATTPIEDQLSVATPYDRFVRNRSKIYFADAKRN